MAKKKPKKKPPGGIPTGSASSGSCNSKSSPPESPKSADVDSKSSKSSAVPETPESSATQVIVDSCKIAPPAISDAAIENPKSETVLVPATVASAEAIVPEIAVGDVVLLPTDAPTSDLAVPNTAPAANGKPPNNTSLAATSSSLGEIQKAPEISDSPWKDLVKESSIKMKKRGTPFILESGEACVTIPNSVIEENKKAWDSFILGQFYEEPPARGAVHAIVNGIWSRQRRDISVSKMEGHSFLFKVPCPNARRRILSQSFWQIDGQTMFVAKWSPSITPSKPELSMVPVWLDFVGVPLEFFNRKSLEHIAGLVGHPICLHPQTEKMTNVEVAKVYTVIDPRKPLPEAVNARFESGVIKRIFVSSPWLPSLCSHCKKVGHTASRCTKAPPSCNLCGSSKHKSEACPRSGKGKRKGKEPIKSQLPIVEIHNQKQPVTQLPPVQQRAEKGTTEAVWQPVKSRKPSKQTLPPQSEKAAGISATKTASPPRKTSSVMNDGKLCVDLSENLFNSLSHGDSLDESQSSDTASVDYSEDEDNPEVDSDRFLKVMSKRLLKKNVFKARAGGPSLL